LNHIKNEVELSSNEYVFVTKGVWRARRVVVKRPHIRTIDLDHFFERVTILTKVSPNRYLVNLMGVSLPPDSAVVFEYVEGKSLLYHLLNPKNEFSANRIKHLLISIAYGMRSLHRSKILHLNLAAHNVLLTPDGTAKISDYGLKGITKSKTYGPRWKAPEYIKTGKGSWKADVWSFGIVVSEVLARDVPWKYLRNSEVYDLLTHKKAVPEIPSNSPTILKQLMQYCLQYDYHDRPSFDTVCQFLEDIS